MHYLRLASGTGAGSGPTLTIGPVLDSAGVEYTGLVIGDVTLGKNGTEAAMAANATLTHVSNGYYSLVMIGNNADTLGRLKLRCNKLTYQFPTVEYTVLTAANYDTLITNGTLGSMTAGETLTVSGGIGSADIKKINNSATAMTNWYSIILTDFASNYTGGKGWKVSLQWILGTLITETIAGQIAAGFKFLLDVTTPVFNLTSKLQTVDNATRAAPGDAMTLTPAERTATANEVENQIIDETDSEKVLTAITNKIASVNPSLAGLTLAAIAAQVRVELTAELARIDVAVSTRLASAGYTVPPTQAQIVTALLTELIASGNFATNGSFGKLIKDNLDLPVSSRSTPADVAAVPATITNDHGAGSYQRNTEPDNAGIGVAAAQATTAATQSTNAASDAAVIKVVTNKLDTALVLSGAVWQYTVNALENAPSGTGSSPAAIAAEVDNVLSGTHGSGQWDGAGSTGSGGSPVTLTGLPPSTEVWITSDSAGATVVAGTLVTDGTGDATFLLDAGATYYLWAQKDGYEPILGQPFVAVAD
jgi:hypothetical protein